MNSKNLPRLIDHTNLRADASVENIGALCDQALEYHFHAVCVNPVYVPLCRKSLRGSQVRICSVVGFPLGSTISSVKVEEAKRVVESGADEIDMVMNIGAARSGEWNMVSDDIRAVVESVSDDIIVKVILETCYLTGEEKIEACVRAVEAGADYVKTSTGFGSSGATVEDVALLRETVGPHIGVKAAGGIRDFATAMKMIEAGATRIGSSASVEIIKGSTR